jgi:hypothetical protein
MTDIIERMKTILREVQREGLIYWEPNTERGHASKAWMLARIDRLLAEAEKLGPAVLCTWHVDGEPKYNYWRIRILDQPKESV